INIDQSWNKFKSSKFQKDPTFYYRPIPINPSALKTKLYNIPLDQIEDPTLSNLFYEKQVELEKTLSMLRDRRTRNFFYGSMQLYGEITKELKSLALNILENTTAHMKEPIDNVYFDCNAFAKKAEEEIIYYKQFFPEMQTKVQIREDITGLMVSKGNLFLGKKIKIPKRRVDALLQHEIGTHIVTYVNGKAQPFQQLYAGLAGYDELQEGIAVLTEYLVGGLTTARLRLLAGRVIAASNLIDGATFIDTFRELNVKFDFTQRIAYIITARIFRGGGLTKDAVYLRGLMNILDYFARGGELEPLLIGKISSNHVPIIKELQARKVLKSLALRPRYLENKAALEKLKELKNGLSVIDLIKRS
ncbi:MAG: flavohemoglobin expression-modulating QEGLA motif protein, partial [Melioribacteraceae bacterium]|nr:flavohemoglobin expression-modulating QEGLA motif protein [Melioribacteraceae bacterium]